MRRAEEWDWPPTRRWRHPPPLELRRTGYRTFDTYQPSGWDAPIAKKIIHIYWRVTITIIKVMITIYLTAIAFAASWLIVTVLTL
jgi:hypothetical protein